MSTQKKITAIITLCLLVIVAKTVVDGYLDDDKLFNIENKYYKLESEFISYVDIGDIDKVIIPNEIIEKITDVENELITLRLRDYDEHFFQMLNLKGNIVHLIIVKNMIIKIDELDDIQKISLMLELNSMIGNKNNDLIQKPNLFNNILDSLNFTLIIGVLIIFYGISLLLLQMKRHQHMKKFFRLEFMVDFDDFLNCKLVRKRIFYIFHVLSLTILLLNFLLKRIPTYINYGMNIYTSNFVTAISISLGIISMLSLFIYWKNKLYFWYLNIIMFIPIILYEAFVIYDSFNKSNILELFIALFITIGIILVNISIYKEECKGGLKKEEVNKIIVILGYVLCIGLLLVILGIFK